jgi:predicted aspartyl protease
VCFGARVRLVTFLVITLAAALSVPAQVSAATSIPVEFRDGRTEPLTFLLDSGASESVVDLSAARRLGLKLGSAQTVQGVQTQSVGYRLASFNGQLAGVRLPAGMLALDLSAVSRMCHQPVDGLLGADFFRRRVVEIDYANEKVRLLTPGELNSATGIAVPMRVRNGVLCVRAGVDGEPAEWARVDTGCNSSLQWVATAEKTSLGGKASVATMPGTLRHFYSDVQIGAERLSDVRIGIHTNQIFAGEAGLIGNGVLSNYKVTFDVDKKRLLLARR